MRPAAALALVFAVAAPAGAPVPRSWITIGPVAIGDSRARVESALGAATDCYRARKDAVCYSDGTAYLSIGFIEGRVATIAIGAAPPSMPGHVTRAPAAIHFATWRLDRQPVLAAKFVPESSWTVERSTPGFGLYDFAEYRVAHGVDRRGGYTSISRVPPAR